MLDIVFDVLSDRGLVSHVWPSLSAFPGPWSMEISLLFRLNIRTGRPGSLHVLLSRQNLTHGLVDLAIVAGDAGPVHVAAHFSKPTLPACHSGSLGHLDLVPPCGGYTISHCLVRSSLTAARKVNGEPCAPVNSTFGRDENKTFGNFGASLID